MRQGGDLDQDLTREVSGVGQNRDPPFFRAKVDPEAPLISGANGATSEEPAPCTIKYNEGGFKSS